MKRNLCIVGGIALFFVSLWGGAWALGALHYSDWRHFPTLATATLGAGAGFCLAAFGGLE